MYFHIRAVFDGFGRIMDRLQVFTYCIILSVLRVYLETILKALEYLSRLPHDSKLIFILSFPSSCSSLFFRCASLTGSLYRLYLFCCQCSDNTPLTQLSGIQAEFANAFVGFTGDFQHKIKNSKGKYICLLTLQPDLT